MDLKKLEELLAAHKVDKLETSEAARRISELYYEDIGYARVDHSRSSRQGFPEVVFGAGKKR
jgi:pyridinium-3,5-biscarboxylic acid mononucleotide synthase